MWKKIIYIKLLQQRSIDSAIGEEPRYVNELPTRIKCNRTRVAASTRREQAVSLENYFTFNEAMKKKYNCNDNSHLSHSIHSV